MMTNGVLIQYFEWYLPNDGQHWNRLRDDAAHLKELGISAVWIPPAYKGQTPDDVGYGCYDLYDLGEFDQKGTVRTKYGTKMQLQAAINALHEQGLSVYLDAVLNHKAGADFKEKFRVREVDGEDRGKETTDAYEIEGWTGFSFPGRKDKYSDFHWHWYHFSATDYDARHDNDAIYKIDGKEWSHKVDDENGNYDFLMFANIDYKHPDVVNEVTRWGIWVADELDLDGFRLDAIKHINADFIRHFISAVREHRGQDFFIVGEYWKDEQKGLEDYLATEDYKMNLFDVPLHFNFAQASTQGCSYDLRRLFDGSLVRSLPEQSVTFVDNHDSQPGQSLESTVEDAFKPSAYALILLMERGYPCIFYGDLYGMRGEAPPHRGILETLLRVRRERAYGEQHEYFDHPNTIGFTREGADGHPGSGVAVLVSNGDDGEKYMYVGTRHAGETWHEATGSFPGETVTIGDDGHATFRVHGNSVAVWEQEPSGE